MWPRICDIILGIWLFLSQFIFTFQDGFPFQRVFDNLSAFAILFFSLLSFHPKWSRMHLWNLLVTAYLIIIPFLYHTPFLPFYLQSHLIIANVLLMTAVIPCRASDSPEEWKIYLNKEDARN